MTKFSCRLHDAALTCWQYICRFVSRLDKAAVAFLQDHSVKGRIILPATAMLEAAAEASSMLHDAVDVSADSALKHTSFLRALALQR